MTKLATFLLIVLILLGSLPIHAQTPDAIQNQIDDMTIRQKVGQLFLINIYGQTLSRGDRDIIQRIQPGGVTIFAFNADGQPPAELAAYIQAAQDASAIPLFVATDHEGGRVQRIQNGVTTLPAPLFLGAAPDSQAPYQVGVAVGAELAALGVNMNLAPVLDLSTRSDMLTPVRVMHRRTWGEDPQRVGTLTAAYAAGLAESGVMAVGKHFPGHGGTADSHAGLVLIDIPAADAYAETLAPFQIAIQNGMPAVMLGHLIYTAFDATYPATLSAPIMSILREEWGYDGLILSDAMDMAALAENYYIPDAALQFFQAGGDVFVTGPFLDRTNLLLSVERVVQAVESGDWSEAELDQRVRRILQAKADFGILDGVPPTPENLNPDATQQALRDAYLDAGTLIRDDAGLLPLDPSASVAIVYHNQSTAVKIACQAIAQNAVYHAYNYTPFAWEYGVVVDMASDADVVIVLTEGARSNAEQQRLVDILPPEKTIVVALAAPYELEIFPAVPTLLTLYDSNPASQAAACPLLFGAHPITGVLPVTLTLAPMDSASGR